PGDQLPRFFPTGNPCRWYRRPDPVARNAQHPGGRRVFLMAGGNTFRPQGALTMREASLHRAKGRELAAAGDCEVDLADVSDADSAALALLFDWQRVARAAGHRLTVHNLPSGLASLASLYGVDELLSASGGVYVLEP